MLGNRGFPEAWSRLCVCQASFLMTFAMGGVPHAGSRQKTEDEMAGWHHGLNGHESEWAPGDGDGQGGLACCDSWGRKESDMTERLNWTELTEKNLEEYYFSALVLLLKQHPYISWRRTRQPTPIFLPRGSCGQRSLAGCHLWGRTESDTTEAN